MNYVSPFGLLEYLQITEDQFSIKHVEQLTSDINNHESHALLSNFITDHELQGLRETLSTIKVPIDIIYHHWIYKFPALKRLLETGVLNNTEEFVINQEMRFSPSFSGFRNFISPLLSEFISKQYQKEFESLEFNNVKQLSQLTQLCSFSRDSEVIIVIRNFLQSQKTTFDSIANKMAFMDMKSIQFMKNENYLVCLTN